MRQSLRDHRTHNRSPAVECRPAQKVRPFAQERPITAESFMQHINWVTQAALMMQQQQFWLELKLGNGGAWPLMLTSKAA
jgi:hypothetical protein